MGKLPISFCHLVSEITSPVEQAFQNLSFIVLPARITQGKAAGLPSIEPGD
jgi:hypothetical protein